MDLLTLVVRFAVVVPAIVFHEVAHGYAALVLGDTTARDQGRLSLNPLRHIDPFGTVLLPLLMTAVLGFGFGYAKPVPVNPWRFRGDRRWGMFFTGISGPLANLIMAVLAGGVVRMLIVLDGVVAAVAYFAFASFALVNLALLFFNLIPIPPFDGSRVLPLFLGRRGMEVYHTLERYGFAVVLAVLWLGPRILGFDPIDVYFRYTVDPLFTLLTGVW